MLTIATVWWSTQRIVDPKLRALWPNAKIELRRTSELLAATGLV